VEFDNATVVPITACPLAHEDLNRTLAAILSGTLEVAEPSGVHRWKDGVPLVLRRSASGEIVAFRDPPERTLTETVLGRPMSVPAGSFSQVNPPVLDRLAAWLRDAYREGSRGALVDAYCGCGVFAVALGDLARSVIGIESDAASVRCAEENARAAGLRDFRFVAGEVERRLAPALEELSRDPEVTLLLDPPRTGCAPEVTDVLRRRQPKTILFVSCDPATLARDLKRLRVGAEYALRRLALFDMFPQTAHFETAAVLARKP
jgi:23S rRNA (uracil1939-C5)-methyltransferase